MSYTATVFAKGDSDKLYECIENEQMSYDRSEYTIKKVEGGIEFHIQSKDAVALRATLNAISQLLIVFEKS